jgi:folate-binding protein YgfZ
MSEAAEMGGTEETAATVRALALDAEHRRAGASMREHDGFSLPGHYGDMLAEYEAVRGGASAGLFDLSARGRVEVSGAEAVQFLNGLITNDVKTLEAGAWMHAAFPNAQGRLLASVRVIREGDTFLFDTEAATHARVLQTLERFTLAGDFRVRDLTAETVMLSVQGARACDFVRNVLGEGASGVKHGRVFSAQLGGDEVTVLRATHTSEDGFDLFTATNRAAGLWASLVEAGARPAGFDALEVLRIEAGVPRYGVDVSDANVVLEAVREEETVSYTKGCYIGQEIIARIHWRGHIAKQLAGLIFDRNAEAPTDAVVKSCDAGKDVGRITSFTYSPRLKRMIALGIVKYDFLTHGTELKIFTGGEAVCEAHVAQLPMVRGSWFDAAFVGNARAGA